MTTSGFPSFPHWTGHHLYYHGNQDPLLTAVAADVLRPHLAAGSLDRFFFVRYALGGPHLRLRCRWRDGAGVEEFSRQLLDRTNRFFVEHPSENSWPEETIRQRNRVILANDPSEADDRVFPDESVREAPFEPETERYGGEAMLLPSLEVFCLSSVAVLTALAAREGGPEDSAPTRPDPTMVLAAQSVAGAEDMADLVDLMRILCERARKPFGGALTKADERFDQAGEGFSRDLFDRLEGLDAPGILDLQVGVERLREGLREARKEVEPVLRSQLHMTANRLGLSNPREAFLLRLLYRAARRWQAEGLSLPRGNAPSSEGTLAEIVRRTLDRFAKGPLQ